MKLTIDSICLISKITDKIQIDKDFIKEMFEYSKSVKEKSKGKSEEEAKEIAESLQKEIGVQVVLKLGTKLYEVRDELIEFISVYKEISKEEAQKIDVVEFVKEVINDKGLTSFLKNQVISK